MNRRQGFVVVVAFALLAGLSAWLQFGVLARPEAANAGAGDAPDYYIEGFVSTGVDADGARYQLSAARLTHEPRAARALLEQPRIVQFKPGAPRRIAADRGWLYDARGEVELAGNVRVTEGAESGDGNASTAAAQTMTVRLK